MTAQFFAQCKTLDELKAEYRRLALKWHPDMPTGDLATMQRINAEYDRRFTFLRDTANGKPDRERDIHEEPEEYRRVIERLIKVDGITIELVGSWVWVSGDTRAHKDELKAAGMRWSGKRRMWYWHPADQRRRRGSRASYAQICAKYGCKRIEREPERSIAVA